MEAGEFVTFTPLFWFNRRAKKSPPSPIRVPVEALVMRLSRNSCAGARASLA
jgi:hypothetical protein